LSTGFIALITARFAHGRHILLQNQPRESCATPRTNAQGIKTVAVTYRYKIANVAGWANSQEMQTAYPDAASALNSNPSDSATLVVTGDHWEFAK
jgi:hypothetical protein